MNDKYKHLTFRQLKYVLSKCKDPKEEHYIRVLMKDKYIRLMQLKKMRDMMKKHTQSDDILDEILDNEQPKQTKSMTDIVIKKKDKNYKPLQSDSLNKNLMNRLTGEIDIHRNADIRIAQKMESPFDDEDKDEYHAPFNERGLPADDFNVDDLLND